MNQSSPQVCPNCRQAFPEGTTLVAQPVTFAQRLLVVLYLAIQLALLCFTLIAIWYFWSSIPSFAAFSSYAENVRVVEAQLRRNDVPTGGDVIILGKIQNESNRKWGNLSFEIRCFDHAGNLVDTSTVWERDLVLVPGAEQTFRLSVTPKSRPEHWANFKVFLRDARDVTIRG